MSPLPAQLACSTFSTIIVISLYLTPIVLISINQSLFVSINTFAKSSDALTTYLSESKDTLWTMRQSNHIRLAKLFVCS